jgi:hypothetical protein
MSKKQISQLTEGTPASNDMMVYVDAAGVTKKTQAGNVPTAGAGSTTFVSLTDVEPNTLDGNLGKIPYVSETAGVKKLKFQHLPSYTDNVGANGLIRGGFVKLAGANWTYVFTALEYVINGRIYDDAPVSAQVTLDDGHATFDRFDTIVVEIDDVSADPPTPSIVVLKGVEDGSEFIPVPDLLTQCVITSRSVAATLTADPSIVSESIYDENTGETAEWDVTDTPLAANLGATTLPAVGTYYITLPAYTSDILEFTKDALFPYVATDVYFQYIKIPSVDWANALVEIRFEDSTDTNLYMTCTLNKNNLGKYGVDPTDSGWQLLRIPFNNFAKSSVDFDQYDICRFTFINTPALEFDWINTQAGIDVAEGKTVTEVVQPQAGTGISIDKTDPLRPVYSSTQTAGLITQVKLTLTPAEIKAIGTTNIDFIAAPAAGIMRTLIGQPFAVMTYGSAPYTANNINLLVDGSATPIFVLSSFIDSVINNTKRFALQSPSDNDIIVTSKIVIDGTDSALTGDSPITIYANYIDTTL